MSFSDLSWESLGSSPVYPKAADVYLYLEEYFKRYIPVRTVCFRTAVKKVERIPDEPVAGGNRWKLHLHETTADGGSIEFSRTFDYLVAAPGFYNIPKMPRSGDLNIPVLHSTRYRTLEDIDQRLPTTDRERVILVVGGSHSGGDIAASIALQLSDAQYSPTSSGSHRAEWKNTRIVHVSSHEMFALPAFVQDLRAPSCTFQPVDFTLFNRSSRPSVGLVTPEKVKASRKMIHTISDGDEGYVDTRETDELAPIGILGDSYPQFVKAGRIAQVRGTLSRLHQVDKGDLVTATIQKVKNDGNFAVHNVCAVIQATGFDTASSLAFLSPQTKMALDHDPTCSPAPFVLDTNLLSQNSSLPTLGLVGYPGAYWPLFEMQARAIVKAWTSPSLPELTNTPSHVEQRSKLRRYYADLRRTFKEGRKDEVPHNPFGDSLGALEQASRELDLERFDLGFSEAEGFVCAARYTEPGSDKTEAMKTLMEVQRVRRGGQQGSFLARAVARGLMGKWVAAGQIPNGEIKVVQLSFYPRYPTDEAFDWEYVAVSEEHGETMRKVYRYSEAADCITVWTVAEDGFRTGIPEYTFQFKHAQQEHGKHTAVAVLVPSSSQGESVDGLGVFRFHFAGSSLKTWTIKNPDGPFTFAELNFVRVGLGQHR
ncbi:uncharacterized protein N0V89_004580 [Didymosphaeria variabile]|uniref:FAD/NAD(P)-binding domain-containing protein n=1 Tax=Didymosphaeria variabile TaxID=1932322 RepID=A0A9W9CDQ3_9PLEO|nr:uncharacterized protein N0V89_004580 [Didymosphaeria variabile]KAJ4356546.1 hypothetical protein N0V89_004580 [Didymosphaeria variabile]